MSVRNRMAAKKAEGYDITVWLRDGDWLDHFAADVIDRLRAENERLREENADFARWIVSTKKNLPERFDEASWDAYIELLRGAME